MLMLFFPTLQGLVQGIIFSGSGFLFDSFGGGYDSRLESFRTGLGAVRMLEDTSPCLDGDIMTVLFDQILYAASVAGIATDGESRELVFGLTAKGIRQRCYDLR